jgi:hypothetical protein
VCDDIGRPRCSFCYDPTGLHNFGGTGCKPNTPCSACQGDCDKDADCFKGLKCFQRNGFTQVHGCSKATGAMNVKNYVRVLACARHTRVWCAMESCELIADHLSGVRTTATTPRLCITSVSVAAPQERSARFARETATRTLIVPLVSSASSATVNSRSTGARRAAKVTRRDTSE